MGDTGYRNILTREYLLEEWPKRSAAEIAGDFGITPRTVRNYVKRYGISKDEPINDKELLLKTLEVEADRLGDQMQVIECRCWKIKDEIERLKKELANDDKVDMEALMEVAHKVRTRKR